MDACEVEVGRWLKSRRHQSVVPEPDGNIPPDILVDGRIAVEVRRFTQVREIGGQVKGLPETTIPIIDGLLSELRSRGPPTDGQSWFVFLSFRGSFKWSTLRSSVRSKLDSFSPRNPLEVLRIQVKEGVCLSFCPAREHLGYRFVLGGYSDHAAGGWVIAELIRSMEFFVAEKSRKIMNHVWKYPEWWLILVDMTNVNFSREDCAHCLQHLPERVCGARSCFLTGAAAPRSLKSDSNGWRLRCPASTLTQRAGRGVMDTQSTAQWMMIC